MILIEEEVMAEALHTVWEAMQRSILTEFHSTLFSAYIPTLFSRILNNTEQTGKIVRVSFISCQKLGSAEEAQVQILLSVRNQRKAYQYFL